MYRIIYQGVTHFITDSMGDAISYCLNNGLDPDDCIQIIRVKPVKQ